MLSTFILNSFGLSLAVPQPYHGNEPLHLSGMDIVQLNTDKTQTSTSLKLQKPDIIVGQL